jgi:hypothetical protein
LIGPILPLADVRCVDALRPRPFLDAALANSVCCPKELALLVCDSDADCESTESCSVFDTMIIADGRLVVLFCGVRAGTLGLGSPNLDACARFLFCCNAVPQ